MTISTISSGIGLKTVAGNNSSIDEKHSVPPRQSAGVTTAPAAGSEARAILLDSTAISAKSEHPASAAPVTPVVNGLGLGLKFSTDQMTGTPVITVINVVSGEVVRQIPAEEVLDVMRQFENGKGALISKKL